jgi:hypothetical protein
MSMALSVFVRDPLPSPREVQDALDQLGLGLSIDDLSTAFDASAGFRPMHFGSGDSIKETGVETYVEHAETHPTQTLALHPQFNRVIWFRWSSRFDEWFCALALGAAIAKATGGVVFDDEQGCPVSLDAIVSQAKEALQTWQSMEAPPEEQAEWPRQFLALVREKFPQYELNDCVRWPCTELVREVDGLYHSQSSFRSDGGYYSHYFAVSACPPPARPASSPFMAGARFGSGCDIWNDFTNDLNALTIGPNRIRGIQSDHRRRPGSQDIVRGCTANAETHLGPLHRKTLANAAPVLLRCIDFLSRNSAVLGDEARRLHYATLLGPVPPTAKEIAYPSREWRSLKGFSYLEAIVCTSREFFTRNIGELPGIADRLARLI